MVEIKNDCCDCATSEYPCRGESCSLRHARHLICDKCGADVEKLFVVDGDAVCLDCLQEMFEVVE